MSDMRDRVLILNSVDGDATSKSHDFNINFVLPQDLGATVLHVIVDKISMSYTGTTSLRNIIIM